MKKFRISSLVIVSLLVILGASIVYKNILNFYNYKDAMCKFVVPQVGGIHIEKLEPPVKQASMIIFDNMKLFSRWNPSAFTNKQKQSGYILNLLEGQTADLYIGYSNIDVREWLNIRSESSLILLSKAYGTWEKVQKAFPTDFALLYRILNERLPDDFNYSSVAMKYPFGYYLFPIFPPVRNYSQEYALFAVKAILVHPEQPLLYAEMGDTFFFILRDSLTAEILYGDITSGSLRGVMWLTGQEGVVTKDLIANVCLCIVNTIH